MGRLGLLPPGFTISTEVYKIFYNNKKNLPKKLISNVFNEIKYRKLTKKNLEI